MKCECFIDRDIDDGSRIEDWAVTEPEARKMYSCCECNGLIAAGERYERAVSFGDKKATTYRTCPRCLEVRKAFFCTFYYTIVWEDLMEEFQGMDDIPLGALDELSPPARDAMISMIDDILREDAA